MDLDLGSSVVYNVKINGESHKLTAPTVLQAKKFQDKIKEKPGEELECFLKFVVDLGMPKEVSENLDLGQLKKLSEALMSVNEKK